MGNSQAKEARPGSSRGGSHSIGARTASTSAAGPSGAGGSSQGQAQTAVYSSRSGRGSRHDLSFLIPGGSSERDPALEPRRETKAEREARKLEKERALRAQERERSIREENVDGGYLVTLGVYTGPEDFSKPVVRQLQIERRLAPFWKGLDDHSDTWTEHQLVAVVNGRPLPAADEIPDEEPPPSNNLSTEWSPRGSNTNINTLTVPITSRSMSQGSDRSANLSPSHPAFSLPSLGSPLAQPQTSGSPFFRGRAKTLATQLTGSRNNSQTEMTKQEVQLPKDPYINGQRIEVFLYKDASECPICFLYYPPYLNKTRCCDQPICSECFVQIKRPDPHPPEHHDSNDTNNRASSPADDDEQLVSEPAACPFCVQPEFGVTYEPPPFRRGIVYANQNQNHLANAASAMSSSSSLGSQGVATPGRRRATSLAANDSTVITTDRVRPDWAKKLADARANALRRAAAATALHNAAYMMGNLEASGSRGFSLGRRRRNMFGTDSAGSSGQGTPRREGDSAAGSSSGTQAQADLFPGRHSSRRGNRLEDLEELMMMEAIRLSLAAEEERKKKEEKEAAKEAKKEEKKKAKEARKAEKASRRSSMFPSSHSTTNLDGEGESSTAAGKGKGVDRSGGSVGFNPLTEPTSTVNTEIPNGAQRHLEESRAQIQREASGVALPDGSSEEHPSHRVALRNLSNASSSASSFAESLRKQSPNASRASLSQDETPNQGTPGTEPMFNFTSLEAVMSADKKDDDGQGQAQSGEVQYIEDIANPEQSAEETGITNADSNAGSAEEAAESQGESSKNNTSPPGISVQPPDYSNPAPTEALEDPEDNPFSDAHEELLEESVTTLKAGSTGSEQDSTPSPEIEAVTTPSNTNNMDTKHIGELSLLAEREREQAREQATQ